MVKGEEVRVLRLVWLVVRGFGESILNQNQRPYQLPNP